MKKVLLGLIIGFVIGVPAFAFAGYAANSNGKLIGGAQLKGNSNDK